MSVLVKFDGFMVSGFRAGDRFLLVCEGGSEKPASFKFKNQQRINSKLQASNSK